MCSCNFSDNNNDDSQKWKKWIAIHCSHSLNKAINKQELVIIFYLTLTAYAYVITLSAVCCFAYVYDNHNACIFANM
jgi:hypothetical protein